MRITDNEIPQKSLFIVRKYITRHDGWVFSYCEFIDKHEPYNHLINYLMKKSEILRQDFTDMDLKRISFINKAIK